MDELENKKAEKIYADFQKIYNNIKNK